MRLHGPITAVRLLVLAAAVAACGGDSTSPPPKVASTLQLISPPGQSGMVGTALPAPVMVQVDDQDGAPMSGVPVTWTVTRGGGTVNAASTPTDANGRAQVSWTLGTVAGSQQELTATVTGVTPVAFAANASMAPPATVALNPLTGALLPGDTIRATGTSADVFGNVSNGVIGDWSSSSDAVATVTQTGLIRAIAPGSAQITATLGASASSVTVIVDAPPAGLNLSIAGMYITQATQTFAGDIPLVAGRDGLLRVFARANMANSAMPQVRVRFYQNGVLADTRIIPPAASSTPTAVDEGMLLSTWNYRIPGAVIQPGMAVLADVDNGGLIAENNEADNSWPVSGTPRNFDIRTVPVLNALFVPVTQPNGTTGDISSANIASYTTLTSALYPFSSINADVRTPYSFDKVLPSAYDSIWSRLLSEIETLRRTEGSARYYYGVFKPAYPSGGSGLGYIGNGSGLWRAAVGIDAPSWRALTVAHEWGHNFGRQHVGCGGPSNPDPLYPHAGGALGRDGWDMRNGALLPNAATFDIMSYCQPVWTSGYTYSAVLGYHAGAALHTMPPPEPSLLVWGRSTPDGAMILEPSFQIDAPPSTPSSAMTATSGRFRLEALDPAGSVIFQISFDGRQVDHLGTRHFSYTVPLSALRGRELSTLRLTSGGREALRQSVRAASSGAAANGAFTEDVRATRAGNGRVRLEWDAARHPMVLVRDARTGEVLSFARGGSQTIAAAGAELDLNLSDGVRSRGRRVRVQQ